MISPELSTFLMLFFFGASSFAAAFGVINDRQGLKTFGVALAIVAFVFQTLTLSLGIHRHNAEGLSIGLYVQLLAWFVLLASFAMAWKLRNRAVILYVCPLAMAIFFLSLLGINDIVRLPESLRQPFYVLHVGSILLAISILFLLGILSAFFLYFEYLLKNKRKFNSYMKDIPALSILEKWNLRLIVVIFPLYSIGIVSGVFWAHETFNISPFDIKLLLGLVIWALVAKLFYMRVFKGITGKKAAFSVLLICLVSLLSALSPIFFDTFHAFVIIG